MIMVKLMGGLGNQMFQYAAARRLANHHDTSLLMDLSFLKNAHEKNTPRVYELKHLNIKANIALPDQIAEFTKNTRKKRPSRILSHLRRVGLLPPRMHFYAEQHFQFDASVLDAPDNTYMSGYWQSEKYFLGIEGIIRDEFVVITEADSWNREMAREIESTESVSIHIRRGDYVSDSVISEYHGVCPLGYYQEAIDAIVSRVRSPHFYVFSDDPAWVRDNLKIRHPLRYMDHNGLDQGHEDLRLMTLCRHHIIANSSFSWWGAWLSHNPGKIVIAPEKWFNKKDINTSDLLPDQWIKID